MFFVESTLIFVFWVRTGAGVNYGFLAIFVTSTLGLCLNMHYFARRWPELSQKLAPHDLVFRSPEYRDYAVEGNVSKQMMSVTILSIIAVVIEFTVFWLWQYMEARSYYQLCGNPTNQSVLQRQYETERPFIFAYVNYRWWMGPLLSLQWLLGDITWMLSLNLVVLLSMWITTRMKQLRNRIEEGLKSKRFVDWMSVYHDFHKLVRIVREVDAEIGVLVTLTTLPRLLTICYDLFKIMRFDEGFYGLANFVCQYVFHSGCIVHFFLRAAQIRDLADHIQSLMLKVPELKVYHSQMLVMKVQFTGKGMFALNKSTLLTVRCHQLAI